MILRRSGVQLRIRFRKSIRYGVNDSNSAPQVSTRCRRAPLPESLPVVAHLVFRFLSQVSESPIRKTHFFKFQQKLRVISSRLRPSIPF